jgi:paraquat-inducible protein B
MVDKRRRIKGENMETTINLTKELTPSAIKKMKREDLNNYAIALKGFPQEVERMSQEMDELRIELENKIAELEAGQLAALNAKLKEQEKNLKAQWDQTEKTLKSTIDEKNKTIENLTQMLFNLDEVAEVMDQNFLNNLKAIQGMVENGIQLYEFTKEKYEYHKPRKAPQNQIKQP